MSSKFPNDTMPTSPHTALEFPPDPMVVARAAATTYLNHVSTAIAHPTQSNALGVATPNVGMLALAALEFETDITLLAQGRTPEILFAPNPYLREPLDNPTNDPVVQTANDLIPIAQCIWRLPQCGSRLSAADYANGVGLYIALRNQLREMLSTMSPLSSNVPWAKR